ncbi:MAG TPA: hypothetical protein VE422_06595 [Terriglobia bacterium]|nr:hypothetical protein [Terriglobia bacterium]
MEHSKELVYFRLCPPADEPTVFLQEHHEFSPIYVENGNPAGIQLFPSFLYFGAKESNLLFRGGLHKILGEKPGTLLAGKSHGVFLCLRIVFANRTLHDFHDYATASTPL